MPHTFLCRALLVASGFLALLMPSSESRAAESAVAEVAQYTGADRQAFLENGARKEGTLQIYTVGSQINPIIKAFNAKYPYVTVRVLKNDIPNLVQRVTQEYKAGVYNVDAFELDDYGLKPLLGAGALEAFTSPEMKYYESDAIEPGKHWVMMRQDYASLGFNTAAIPPGQAPRTYKDLLAPKWKGKMALAARPSSLTLWVGALVLSEGEDFVRALGKQNVRPYNMGGAAVDNLVGSGEAPMVLDSRRSHIFKNKLSGAKVEWRAIGPSYTAVSGAALAARAPHPHAGMLFVDFLLSKEAQEIYAQKLGYASMRKGMTAADAPTQKLYLTLRPNFEEEYRHWNDLAETVFMRPH